MKNDVEKMLKTAVEHSVPDVLDNILSQCGEQKETVIVMTKTKKKFAAIAAVAAAFFIFVSTGALALRYNNTKLNSIITLDVNPSIELKTTKQDRIISAEALNPDAEKILDGMDLKNVKLDVAVNAVVGSMLKNGFISDIQNSILVSVDNADSEKSKVLQKEISKNIEQMLESVSISPAILTQSVSDDDEINKLVNEYGISVGKAALIKGIIEQDKMLKESDLTKLNINEINSIIEAKNAQPSGIVSVGKANDAAYIGAESAKKTALDHAGVGTNVERLECEIDVDDGMIVYDVEFYKDGIKYEYEIGGTNGKIIKSSKEKDDDFLDDDDRFTGDDPITKAQAADIAYKHAGISSADNSKIEYDNDDGAYDVEFYKDGVKYEYEINGANGKIIKSSKEKDDDFLDDDDRFAGNAAITKAQAADIAYKHAGISSADNSKIEYDNDDGSYDVEFYKDGIKYEYEINGANGKIIESSSETNDRDNSNDDDDDDD